jgi:hypothetical protein
LAVAPEVLMVILQVQVLHLHQPQLHQEVQVADKDMQHQVMDQEQAVKEIQEEHMVVFRPEVEVVLVQQVV